MRNYDLVLFDMDGTLVDSAQPHRDMFLRFWQAYYPQVDAEKMDFIGNSLREIFHNAGFADGEINGIFNNLEIFYDTQADDVIARMAYIPGTRETISALRAGGIQVGMVTNSMDIIARKVAVVNKINGVFDLIVGADRSFDHKAERFEKVKKMTGIPGSRILYVGDNENDPPAAEQAGIDCCVLYAGIGWVQSEENLMKNHMPDFIIKDIRNVATIAL